MFGLAILVLSLLALVGSAFVKKEALKKNVRGVAGIVLFTGFVITVISSFSIVPTRNVGIVTEFNKPTGRTTGAGMQWHAPWQSVDDWDASRNTFDRLGGKCLWLSVSGGRSCIAVQIEWSAKAENAPADWASYKEVDKIEGGRFGTYVARRVNPQMDSAITATFAAFNPLGQVDPVTGALKAPVLDADYREPLKRNLTTALGTSLTIDSIAFGTPTYDEATTAAISAFGQKTLEKRNLGVDKENALIRKSITDIDAKVDPIARCLSIAEKMNKEPGLCMTPATITRPVS